MCSPFFFGCSNIANARQYLVQIYIFEAVDLVLPGKNLQLKFFTNSILFTFRYIFILDCGVSFAFFFSSTLYRFTNPEN